ncbi:putative monoacylglycerol lipase ABHD6 [Cocos nucifera]|nr:putative monoacylglycerol lipase ABHD6 [Cocos nucifera]
MDLWRRASMVTWQVQIPALTTDYSVYIPDLLFFGGSITGRGHRTPVFQVECLAAALGKLGVERCSVVGFSYGGMIAFKMAEARPELVQSLVVPGSVISMTESINEAALKALGVSSLSELLLPETLERLKALLSIATYKKR